MTDISVTATAVIAGAGASIENGTAGAIINGGQVVYRDTTTVKYLLADSNGASALIRTPRGIALHSAAVDQPLAILKAGDLTMNAALTAGTDYYLSDTPGGICPRADIGAAEYVVLLGLAKSTTVLAVDIQYPGVAL